MTDKPPPPGCLDLGNGEAIVTGGTAAAVRAAADYLDRHYPEGVTGPRSGPYFGAILMTDARFPERWLNAARLQRVTPGAYRLFGNGLMWAVANRTDGHVPRWALAMIPHGAEADANELAAAGLWAVHEMDGWTITDFEATQTSRTELEILDNARRRDREKKRRQRADVPGDSPGGQSPGTNGGTALGQARPGPSGPDLPVLQDKNQAPKVDVGGGADDAGGPGDGESPGTVTGPARLSSAANSQNPRVHHGSFNGGPQAQQNSHPLTPRSPAADRNARASTPAARRADALRSEIRSYIAANPGCTGNQLQAVLGGHRDNLLRAVRDLVDSGAVRRSRDVGDGRVIRYAAANGTAP